MRDCETDSRSTDPGKPDGGGKKLLVFAAAGAAVLGGLAYWRKTVVPPVNFDAPTPVMPSPNGYDYFVAASEAIVDRIRVNAALSAHETPTEVRALKTFEELKAAWKAYEASPPNPMTWQEKEAIVAANAKALDLIREGLRYECMSPLVRSDPGLGFRAGSALKECARLLMLEARVRAHQGDYGGAMDSCADACEMGAKAAHGANMIGMLVAAACEASGRHEAWDLVAKLDAASARRAVARFERILADSVSYADTLAEEKWSDIARHEEEINRRGSLPALGATIGLSRPPFPMPPAPKLSLRDRLGMTIESLHYMWVGKRRALENQVQYMDACIATAKKPYPAWKPWPTASDCLSRIMAPVFEQSGFKPEVNRAMDGLLCVSLALRAYKVEHGSYPSSLDSLVPEYLTALPDDPFALDGTFRYRRKGRGYLLYSLGPDCKDDGGKPAVGTQATDSYISTPRYAVYEDSVGDIVAGINR